MSDERGIAYNRALYAFEVETNLANGLTSDEVWWAYEGFRWGFDAGYEAGVAEGIRQARETVAAVDPGENVTPSLVGGWTLGKRQALRAIDAL